MRQQRQIIRLSNQDHIYRKTDSGFLCWCSEAFTIKRKELANYLQSTGAQRSRFYLQVWFPAAVQWVKVRLSILITGH